MRDEIDDLVEGLRQRGVPEPLAQQVEWLAREVDGFLVAGGWDNPAGQAEQIAGHLSRYVRRFRKLAENARIMARRCDG